MAAFPSREIPSCRLSSAPAKHQVGFTHPVKGIMSRSSGLTYQCSDAILHQTLQSVPVLTKLAAEIACEAMRSQAPKK